MCICIKMMYYNIIDLFVLLRLNNINIISVKYVSNECIYIRNKTFVMGNPSIYTDNAIYSAVKYTQLSIINSYL